MEIKTIFYDFGNLNTQAFIYLNKLTNYGCFPQLFKMLSTVFYYKFFLIYFLIACLICVYKVRQTEKPLKTRKIYQYIDELFCIAICYCLFTTIYGLLKHTVNLPRPYCSLPTDQFQTILQVSYERCLSSFPSAHIALSVIIMYYLWSHLNKLFKSLSVICIIMVALSRIALAMHYPADIIYGIIICCIMIFITNFIHKRCSKEIVGAIANRLNEYL